MSVASTRLTNLTIRQRMYFSFSDLPAPHGASSFARVCTSLSTAKRSQSHCAESQTHMDMHATKHINRQPNTSTKHTNQTRQLSTSTKHISSHLACFACLRSFASGRASFEKQACAREACVNKLEWIRNGKCAGKWCSVSKCCMQSCVLSCLGKMTFLHSFCCSENSVGLTIRRKMLCFGVL